MDGDKFTGILNLGSGAVLIGCAVVAFAIGAIYGVLHEGPWSRAGEAALMCLFGGLVSRAFVDVLLVIGDDRHLVWVLVGWGFFLFPGAVDSVVLLYDHFAGHPLHYVLTTPDTLLWFALFVGAAVGAGHGTLRTYDFNSVGPVQFVGDLTWGLCGSTTATLVLLFNVFFGERPPTTVSDESRAGANRFVKGLHFPGKDTFAFTQGATMSNLSDGPGTSLWLHERTHVMQSRAFGPLYTISYLAWMAVFVVVTPFIALFRRQNVFKSIESVCYFSNPWETWAYFRQRRADGLAAGDANEARQYFCEGRQLSELAVIILGVPLVVAMAALPVVLLLA